MVDLRASTPSLVVAGQALLQLSQDVAEVAHAVEGALHGASRVVSNASLREALSESLIQLRTTQLQQVMHTHDLGQFMLDFAEALVAADHSVGDMFDVAGSTISMRMAEQ